MIERGNRDARPFGTRRAEDRPAAWPAEAEPASRDGAAPPAAPGPLSWALRTAGLVGFAAVLATQYLVRHSTTGPDQAVRVAQSRHGLPPDPETTGSIGGVVPARTAPGALAAATAAERLSPCVLAQPVRSHP